MTLLRWEEDLGMEVTVPSSCFFPGSYGLSKTWWAHCDRSLASVLLPWPWSCAPEEIMSCVPRAEGSGGQGWRGITEASKAQKPIGYSSWEHCSVCLYLCFFKFLCFIETRTLHTLLELEGLGWRLVSPLAFGSEKCELQPNLPDTALITSWWGLGLGVLSPWWGPPLSLGSSSVSGELRGSDLVGFGQNSVLFFNQDQWPKLKTIVCFDS